MAEKRKNTGERRNKRKIRRGKGRKYSSIPEEFSKESKKNNRKIKGDTNCPKFRN